MKSFTRNIIRPTLLLAAMFSLASCGGGGGGGSTTATATITSISPAGLVASTTKNLYLYGTNFTSGMTLSITSSLTTTNVTPTAITSTLISVSNFSIATAPTERYVTVNVLSNGSIVASTILGVASVSKTLSADIQTIFNNNSCYTCHTGVANIPDLSNATNASSTLINISSTKCSNKFRVTAGDPRRANNVLLDVLYAKTTPAVMSCNTSTSPDRRMPQGVYPALTQPELDAITEWIAGGAN